QSGTRRDLGYGAALSHSRGTTKQGARSSRFCIRCDDECVSPSEDDRRDTSPSGDDHTLPRAEPSVRGSAVVPRRDVQHVMGPSLLLGSPVLERQLPVAGARSWSGGLRCDCLACEARSFRSWVASRRFLASSLRILVSGSLVRVAAVA